MRKIVNYSIQNFPFTSHYHSLIALRVTLAILFMAHAAVRVYLGTIPQFASFLTNKGFPFATAMVWGITAYELLGGLLLIAGIYTRWVTIGFLAIAIGGIVIIHFSLGWFVGEHGTGGMEYSVLLAVALLVVAAADRENIRG